MVATPLSVDGIAAQDEQEVLIAESDEQIAAAALRLLADPAAGARLGAAGRALIEAKYSWTQVVTSYEAIYQEVTA